MLPILKSRLQKKLSAMTSLIGDVGRMFGRRSSSNCTLDASVKSSQRFDRDRAGAHQPRQCGRDLTVSKHIPPSLIGALSKNRRRRVAANDNCLLYGDGVKRSRHAKGMLAVI
jgi:hypothetical protein